MAAFIADQLTAYGIPHATSCRALGSRSPGSNKWKDRPASERQTRRLGLADQVRELFERFDGTYGSPRIFIELTRAGWRLSVNTVAKVMAELGPVVSGALGNNPQARGRPALAIVEARGAGINPAGAGTTG